MQFSSQEYAMRSRSFHVVTTLAFILSVASQAVAQDVDPHVGTALDCSQNGSNCKYWEPVGYDAQMKYPLVIYLHGAGESLMPNGTPNGHLQSFAGLLMSFFNPDTGQPKDPVFVMAPQCSCDLDNQKWVNWPWEMGAYSMAAIPESPALIQVRSQIDALRGKYNIDPDRLYVVGVSMGGFGAWDMIARHPDIFAAGSPAAGGGAPDAAPMMKNMASWPFHNADDGAVPVSGDREMFAALAKAGSRPTYTERNSGGHTDGGNSGNSNFTPWLYAQRRGVPATSTPDMQFSPEGGQVSSPVTITLSSSFGGTIRYTTDLTIPSATSTLYNGPITLTSSAVLIAVATGDGQSVFHAAPFKVGDSPLPAGAELMDGPIPLPPPATGGATGAGGSSGTGGMPSNPAAAAGGAGNSTSGNGGSTAQPLPSSGSGSAMATVPPGTVPTGTMMPSGQTSNAGTGSGRVSSSGCSSTIVEGSQAGALGVFWLFGLTAVGLRSRRRALNRQALGERGDEIG